MQCQDVDKSAWKRVGTRAVLEQRENTHTQTHTGYCVSGGQIETVVSFWWAAPATLHASPSLSTFFLCPVSMKVSLTICSDPSV